MHNERKKKSSKEDKDCLQYIVLWDAMSSQNKHFGPFPISDYFLPLPTPHSVCVCTPRVDHITSHLKPFWYEAYYALHNKSASNADLSSTLHKIIVGMEDGLYKFHICFVHTSPANYISRRLYKSCSIKLRLY